MAQPWIESAIFIVNPSLLKPHSNPRSGRSFRCRVSCLKPYALLNALISEAGMWSLSFQSVPILYKLLENWFLRIFQNLLWGRAFRLVAAMRFYFRRDDAEIFGKRFLGCASPFCPCSLSPPNPRGNL
jgi:hypothetical protein